MPDTETVLTPSTTEPPFIDDGVPQLLPLWPECARRPPDRRWQVAQLLHSGERWIPEDWRGEWVQRACCFLRGRASPEPGGEALRAAITAAHALSMRDENLQRSEIEARLLAGQTFAEIAQITGHGPGIIEAYHELFFHVQPSLHARSFIRHTVLATELTPYPNDPGSILKEVGYFQGLLMLELTLQYYRDPPQLPADLSSLDTPARRALARRFMVQAHVLCITDMWSTPCSGRDFVLLDAVQRLEQVAGAPELSPPEIQLDGIALARIFEEPTRFIKTTKQRQRDANKPPSRSIRGLEQPIPDRANYHDSQASEPRIEVTEPVLV